MTAPEVLKINDDLFLTVHDRGIVAWNCRSGRRHALSLDALRAVIEPEFRAIRPELAEALRSAEILTAVDPGLPQPWRWDALSRIFHFGTAQRRTAEAAATPEAAGRAYLEHCASIAPDMPADAFTTRRGAGDVSLPAAASPETENLRTLFEARRTNRVFDDTSLAFGDVAQILDETFRYRPHDAARFARAGLSTVSSRRSAPSGGSLQSCEAYLFARNVTGLERGVYHYRSSKRTLGLIRGLDHDFSFGRVFLDQMFADSLAAAIVITCRLDKLMWKYSELRAYRVALFDAGHLSQNAQLLATALDIRTWPTAAFYDDELTELLELKEADCEYPLLVLGLGSGEVNPLEPEAWAVPQSDVTAE